MTESDSHEAAAETPSTPEAPGAAPVFDEEKWTWISVGFRGGLALLALVIGIGIFTLLAKSRSQPEESGKGSAPLVVETVRVSPQTVRRPWQGYGTARAMDSADVASEVVGRVIERADNIEPGETVEAGQVLLRLDPHDFEQRVASARDLVTQLNADLSGLDTEEARLTQQVEYSREEAAIAQRNYDRTLEANSEGAGSPGGIDASLGALRAAQRSLAAIESQLDQIPTRRASLKARITSAEASLSLAERDLQRSVITAPVSGVLQSVGPEVGEWVAIGQTVARVVDLSKIEVPLRLPASAAASVSLGDEAHLASDQAAATDWAGAVKRMAPEADEASRTMTLFVEIDQSGKSDRLLRPGQFVMGKVMSLDDQPRVLIPRRAVLDDRVFVARKDPDNEGMARAEPMPVEVLYSIRGQFPGLSPDDTEWAVVRFGGGLRTGDQIISSNLEQMRAGMLVDPRDMATSGAVENTVDVGAGGQP